MSLQSVQGRRNEVFQLENQLDEAGRNRGSISFISGDAGSGKTTLARSFARAQQKVDSDLIVAVGSCNAQTGVGDPYLPFREILEMLCGDESVTAKAAISPENAQRIDDVLEKTGQILLDVAPDLIGTLIPGTGLIASMGFKIGEKFGWTSKSRKEIELRRGLKIDPSRIFEQFTDLLVTFAADQPVLIILDDLQWADTASIGLLFHLSRRISSSKLMIVGTYRPEEIAVERSGNTHPLESVLNEVKRYEGDVIVDLGDVSDLQKVELVNAIVDEESNQLNSAFRQTLLAKTGGHALFTTELLRDLKESGKIVRDDHGRWIERDHIDWNAMPARVEGAIAQRIDRLSEAQRDIVSVASVQGLRFIAQVVATIQDIDELDILKELSRELDKKHGLVGELGELCIERAHRPQSVLF